MEDVGWLSCDWLSDWLQPPTSNCDPYPGDSGKCHSGMSSDVLLTFFWLILSFCVSLVIVPNR